MELTSPHRQPCEGGVETKRRACPTPPETWQLTDWRTGCSGDSSGRRKEESLRQWASMCVQNHHEKRRVTRWGHCEREVTGDHPRCCPRSSWKPKELSTRSIYKCPRGRPGTARQVSRDQPKKKSRGQGWLQSAELEGLWRKRVSSFLITLCTPGGQTGTVYLAITLCPDSGLNNQPRKIYYHGCPLHSKRLHTPVYTSRISIN